MTSLQTPPSSNRRQLIALTVICSVLLGVSLWFGQQLIQSQQNNDGLFAPAPNCQLPLQHCSATDGSRTIELAIDAKTLSSHQPIPIRVILDGYPKAQVSVRLQGVEMYMGENQTPLLRHPDGSYRADLQLPVCTTGTMLWRAQVIIKLDNSTSGSWFDFEAG